MEITIEKTGRVAVNGKINVKDIIRHIITEYGLKGYLTPSTDSKFKYTSEEVSTELRPNDFPITLHVKNIEEAVDILRDLFLRMQELDEVVYLEKTSKKYQVDLPNGTYKE